jgi:hypothetical protein
MHSLWHWLLWLLTVWSSDPAAVARERAVASGCVSVAYAALAEESVPQAAPVAVKAPSPPCPDCKGTGRIYRSDGGYVRCKCGACPTGKCEKVLP